MSPTHLNPHLRLESLPPVLPTGPFWLLWILPFPSVTRLFPFRSFSSPLWDHSNSLQLTSHALPACFWSCSLHSPQWSFCVQTCSCYPPTRSLHWPPLLEQSSAVRPVSVQSLGLPVSKLISLLDPSHPQVETHCFEFLGKTVCRCTGPFFFFFF